MSELHNIQKIDVDLQSRLRKFVTILFTTVSFVLLRSLYKICTRYSIVLNKENKNESIETVYRLYSFVYRREQIKSVVISLKFSRLIIQALINNVRRLRSFIIIDLETCRFESVALPPPRSAIVSVLRSLCDWFK